VENEPLCLKGRIFLLFVLPFRQRTEVYLLLQATLRSPTVMKIRLFKPELNCTGRARG
jgi:hypothetical protein